MEKIKKFFRNILPITDDEFSNIEKYLTSKSLSKGEYFVKEGKICKELAFIDKGLLRVYYLNDKSEDVTACFCIENSLTTSYKSFILKEPSTSSIQALSDTNLWILSYDNLERLYDSDPKWQKIGRIIAEREFIVMEKYASVLNNETAKEKYIRLINEQPEVINLAKVEDIASYIGVTRRTLSRIRNELSTS